MKNKWADILLLMVAFIWGFGFVGTQTALDYGVTPIQVVGSRFLVSLVLLTIIFWKEVKKIKKDTFKAGVMIGIFLFLAFLTQTMGQTLTTTSKSAFITATNVVMVPFIYWFISKERPDRYSFGGALLTIIGISFLTMDEGFQSINKGDVMVLICALFFALHIFSTGHFTKLHSPVQLTVIQIGTACVLGLLGILMEGIVFQVPITNITSTPQGIGAILYLGIFSTTIAYLLQNIGQKYTTATKAAIYLSTEAVFGTISSILFLNEKMSVRMIGGFILIFIAIILTETKLSFLRKEKKD